MINVLSIVLSKEDELEICSMLRSLEQTITPLIKEIHAKYPSVIVGLNTRFRSSHQSWDKEKGGEVQATFCDFNAKVNPETIVWH